MFEDSNLNTELQRKGKCIHPRNFQYCLNCPSQVLTYNMLWLLISIITISIIFFLIFCVLIAGSQAQRRHCLALCAYDNAWQITGIDEHIYQANE